jgi:hypothetical protein
VKFVSDPAPPPRLVDITDEGKSKAKERREVGEGDDTVTIEDTSEKEDGETLQERFQLGPSSADLDCPISPSLIIHRLSWRLIFLHRQEGRAMWRESVSPRS